MKYIDYKYVKDRNYYKVVFYNGTVLGEIVFNECGDWVYFPKLNGGYWEAWVMRNIANKLDSLNGE